MTKANYQLRAPPVGPLQSAANGQKYGLFSATLNVRSDTDASPPLHATALRPMARGLRSATPSRDSCRRRSDDDSDAAAVYQCSHDAPVAETIPDWNGGNPALDWRCSSRWLREPTGTTLRVQGR